MHPDLDLTILRIMQKKEYFNSYMNLVDQSMLSKEAKTILNGYNKYYSSNKIDRIDLAKFSPYFLFTLHPNWSTADHEYYKLIFSKLCTLTLDDISTVLERLKSEQLRIKIEQLAQKNDFQAIVELIQSRPVELTTEAAEFTLDNILVDSERTSGVRFRLSRLNQILNPLLPGDFGCVFGYTNTGKSFFLISESSFIATNLEADKKVLYFTNEGSPQRIKNAIFIAAIGKPLAELSVNKEAAFKEYVQVMHGDKDRIMVFDAYGKDMSWIENECAKHNPGLIVIDQMDNIISDKAKENITSYGSLYERARQLSTKYCPVLGATQASANALVRDKDGNTHQRRYLDQSDMYNSKVMKQGAMEFCIGIGQDTEFPHLRYISVPRSKLPGTWHDGDRTFECGFSRQIYRLED